MKNNEHKRGTNKKKGEQWRMVKNTEEDKKTWTPKTNNVEKKNEVQDRQERTKTITYKNQEDQKTTKRNDEQT